MAISFLLQKEELLMGLFHFINDDEKMHDFLFTKKEDFIRDWGITKLEYKDNVIAYNLVLSYLKSPTSELKEALEMADISLDSSLISFCKSVSEKDCYILEEQEYNFVDAFLEKTGLMDDGFYLCQMNTGKNITDAFYDQEEAKYMSLQNGLEVLYDSAWDEEDLKKVTKLQEKYKSADAQKKGKTL